LHATPPPSTTRRRPRAARPRAVFSTSVVDERVLEAARESRALGVERRRCARTALSTAVLSPLKRRRSSRRRPGAGRGAASGA
jgi:hypothetical protein